ncbi:MAG TPA: hypothetical protein VFK05_26465, partial [Polyangiaceae bacterium]|nr:hypothetical protein [Polyangiaceae bacterium]
MLRSISVRRRSARLLHATLLGFSTLSASAARAHAEGCADSAPFSPCFDANSLWLPAGRATFASMPDTRVMAIGQLGFGSAAEFLHQPVVLRVASPDRDGRDIHVVDHALDVSYFLSLGLATNLEMSMLASLRVSQSGAGAGGIVSQSAAPLSPNAVRDPRLGVAYSLDDALGLRGFGLRLGLDATLPLGERNPFANERSFVVMPNTTFGYRLGALQLSAELGARLRRTVDFGGVSLGNQAFVALGVAASVFPGWLTVSAEAFGLPALSDSRGSAAGLRVTSARLFPAEWLGGLHSSFGQRGPWTLSLAAGGGIPLSSETRDSSSGPETSHFVGMTSA